MWPRCRFCSAQLPGQNDEGVSPHSLVQVSPIMRGGPELMSTAVDQKSVENPKYFEHVS